MSVRYFKWYFLFTRLWKKKLFKILKKVEKNVFYSLTEIFEFFFPWLENFKAWNEKVGRKYFLLKFGFFHENKVEKKYWISPVEC